METTTDYTYKGYRIFLALSGKWFVMLDDKDCRRKRGFNTEEEARAFVDKNPSK